MKRIDVHCDTVSEARDEARRMGLPVVAQVGQDVVVVGEDGRYYVEFRG